MSGFDEATRRQHDAARPEHSTWLSANAGSGKTRVLTDRAARLLLEGVPPERILCLTYTKAAASEMQNRLFGRLGEWAMLSDEKLTAELARIGVEHPPSLNEARTLFARAIEAPGGLKIQTIHSFCAAILRRFPLEAGVAPKFTEIDETRAKKLIDEVVGDLAEGGHGHLLEDAGRYISSDSFAELAAEIMWRQDGFPNGLSEHDIWQIYGLPQGYREDDARESVCVGIDADQLNALVGAMRSGTATMDKVADAIAAFFAEPENPATFAALSIAVLRRDDEQPKTNVVKGKRRDDLGSLAEVYDQIASNTTRAAAEIRSVQAAHRTLALHRLAGVFLPAYRAAKDARGWLDFDDLIRRTRTLLSHAPSASWVLYKLDGGIDHILVDEAQDTSPAQWDVIAKLAEEMVAGKGRDPDRSRTIFVVGDKKQSIYSFQGADPSAFDHMATHFATRLSPKDGLNRLNLVHSFRSSEAVLRAVDETYVGDGEDIQRHRAFFERLPGRVDLWPVIPPDGSDEPENWWDPVDLPGKNHHSVVLSRKIAEFIETAIRNETLPDKDRRRPIHAGDFLILVQGRQTPLFHNIIRALKSARIPVAGADRLRLAAELAVKDLLSLLRFLALPEDDLSLAEVLRSPLIGLSEADLFALSHGRPGYLWATFRDRREDFPDAYAFLQDMLRVADFLRPYELLETVLTNHNGRRKLLARLGDEAEDGLDLLLSQALNYEASDVPSLTGFLTWAESADAEIKRQADQAGRQVRVMTVHGAKGLESPIVILPDTLKGPRAIRDDIVVGPDGIALWKKGPSDLDPGPIADARAIAMEREREERQRLLYVAMTRAEKWLVVCGSGEPPRNHPCWHSEIEGGLRRLGAVSHDSSAGSGLRYHHGAWDEGPLSEDLEPEQAVTERPEWLETHVPAIDRPPMPISPSDLPGAKTLPGEGGDRDESLTYGSQLHLLLEHLPNAQKDHWSGIAVSLLPKESVQIILEDARRLLEDPDLAFVFGPESLAEVGITAEIDAFGGKFVHGSIDRLIVEADRVLAVDFKSNRVVPTAAEDTPDGILRQMAAYALALEQVFPGKQIDTAILWTKTAKLMVLPHDIVMKAVESTPTS